MTAGRKGGWQHGGQVFSPVVNQYDFTSEGGSEKAYRKDARLPSKGSRQPSKDSKRDGCKSPRGCHTSPPCSGFFQDVAERLEARVGLAQLSGRFHKHPRTIEMDYDVTETALGSGCNGSVRLATSKTYPSHKFAVKAFNFAGVPLSKREQLESEIEVFLSIDHPHIARLNDVYEYEESISLVMEYMEGGELFDRLAKLKRFSEGDAARAAWQMLLALNYIHYHGIIHGDVKLENFMYDSKDCDHLKLIDFGFSKWSAESTSANTKRLCGTVSYIAPEALEMKFSSQCDQWSLGVVVFVLLAGYMPFTGSQSEQIQKISEGRYVMREDRWGNISTDARNFTQALLQHDPRHRLTAQAALDHPFIKGAHLETKAVVDTSIVQAMRDYGHVSRFRRCCLQMIAWSLSHDEQAKVEEYFLALDTEHHGALTYDDLRRVIVDKYHLPCGEFKKICQAMDTNQDKEIHYSDFLAAMLSTQIGINEEHLYEAFRKFDTHDCGYITAENLHEVLGDKVAGMKVERIMHEADPLDRGYITYHEFAAIVQGRPLHFHGDEVASNSAMEMELSERYCHKKKAMEWLPDALRCHLPKALNHFPCQKERAEGHKEACCALQ